MIWYSFAHILPVKNISNEKDPQTNLNQNVDMDLVLMLAVHSPLKDLGPKALHPCAIQGSHRQVQGPVSHNWKRSEWELNVWVPGLTSVGSVGKSLYLQGPFSIRRAIIRI